MLHSDATNTKNLWWKNVLFTVGRQLAGKQWSKVSRNPLSVRNILCTMVNLLYISQAVLRATRTEMDFEYPHEGNFRSVAAW